MAYGSGQARHSFQSVAHPLIKSGKLGDQKTEGQVRINLGCGHIPFHDYVNIDMRDLPGTDVVADAGNLPIEPGTVQELYSAHMLEHFPEELLRRRLLPYWRTLLAPGGIFRAVVPDGQAMLQGVAAGTYPFKDFHEVLFGGQDYAGDFHYALFTPDTLADLLREAAFNDIRIVEKARRNGKCFEFEIQASRDRTERP
jgi:predicted SAM-dependent methyltransferase